MEVDQRGINRRFVVTNRDDLCSQSLYDHYTDRGQTENFIKAFKNHLSMDRLSCHRFLANQFRLLLHALAYQMFVRLRDYLHGTPWHKLEIETLRRRVLKIGARSTSQALSSSKSRDWSIEKPRCSRTSVKCCEARLLASSVGLNLVRADLELVRDKAGGRSRSCAQIARNEAEVAKCTKLKRDPQAVCCPPPDGDEVSVGTRQRECSESGHRPGFPRESWPT